MRSLLSWFRRLVAVGETVCPVLTQDEIDYQLVTQVRTILCDRWRSSVRFTNDGSLTEDEFSRFVLNKKRVWWRWNFGEDMPAA